MGYSDPQISDKEINFGQIAKGEPDAESKRVERSIIKGNLKDLRGEIDAFFDTLIKAEKEDIPREFAEDAMMDCLERLEEHRSLLAGFGLNLPNVSIEYDLESDNYVVSDEGINRDNTTDAERMHRLGEWTYRKFDEEYPWRKRLRKV